MVTEKEFIIVSNRGATNFAPANTIPAVTKAIELGADAVLVDVRRTRDGRLILLQDEAVLRSSGVEKAYSVISSWVKK